MRRKMFRFGISTIVLLTVLWVVPASSEAEEDVDPASEAAAPNYTVVKIEVSSRSEMEFLARWIDIWDADPERGEVEGAVDAEGIEMLDDFGFRFVVDREKTDKYSRPLAPLKNQTEGIPGYPCYRTVEETLADGATLAATYPDLAQWIDIGDSWEKTEPGGLAGYDLMVLNLTNTTNGIPSADKPDLWVMGAIHSRELVTAETVTRFTEHLLANYDLDPDVTWLLDHHEIHVLLQANPDGRKHAETGDWWRKNTNGNYCGAASSYRGADLNRNFDFEWACCGGSSGSECETTYRGASPASEPETRAVQDYIASNFPDWRPDDLSTPSPDNATGIFIDVHSHGGDVLTAFGWQDPPPPNDLQILRLGRKFSGFTGYYARLGSVYTVDGATKDWGYGRMGMPAFTFELGTEFFENCALFESTIYPDNLQALLYAARAIRAPYTQPSGPEVLSPQTLPSLPGPGETVVVNAVVDDTRFGPGEAFPPISVETIAAAEMYLDTPPWQPGAVAIPMAAADGSFNSLLESVTASFGSGGLSGGRHTVFIRAQDSAGYWGTVRAVWFWVVDPSSPAHITGTLIDSVSGAPVDGVITAGLYSTASSPATGSYDLAIPAGTYDITADAVGYSAQTVTGVVATQGSTTIEHFSFEQLDPLATAFSDDVETGNIGWTADPSWAIVTNQSHSPVSSWHESPAGSSPDNASLALEAPPLDLRGATGVRLSFWHRYAIESNYDYGHVEWSVNGGESWIPAATFTGTQSSWTLEQISLPGLDGAGDARVRFRFTSDGGTSYDGWYIDDITIRGSLFSDGFESGDTSAWTAAGS